uniref:Flagellar biosynthesis anti-sigma factor FlgM n=1 Tax=Heterorhabditis bacteriophora TaxID=37862 RepID=A0A1I7WWW0_HETBA
MTHTQREANTHQDPLNQRDNYSEQKISEIRNKAYSTKGNHDEIDSLTQQLIHGLQSGHPTPTRY